MSEIVRLTLVSHAMTDAMSAGRFPTDEPLNAIGQRQADAALDLGPVDIALCGPEKSARQTAELLGISPSTLYRRLREYGLDTDAILDACAQALLG